MSDQPQLPTNALLTPSEARRIEDAYARSSYSGPEDLPPPETRSFSFTWTLTPAEDQPLDPVHVILVSDLDGFQNFLGYTSTANIISVHATLFPVSASNVDIAIGLHSNAWLTAPDRTVTQLFNVPNRVNEIWRADKTAGYPGRIPIPWPRHSNVTSSLLGAPPNLDNPALFIAFRAAAGTVGVPTTPVYISIDVECRIAGRGYYGLPP
jgi:hypothetical protein